MPASRVGGYAIVSEDGMIANADGIMPESLKFEADKRFFEKGLNGVDVSVHGRHSHEQQPHSPLRHRIVLTRRISGIAPHPTNPKAVHWNPAGASFEDALEFLGTPNARVGIVGGTDVFDLFLDRYDVFHLSQAPGVKLAGGRPVFHGVPARNPEEVLRSRGFEPGERKVLDPDKSIVVVSWRGSLSRNNRSDN
jgi:dihydrofolate reductase